MTVKFPASRFVKRLKTRLVKRKRKRCNEDSMAWRHLSKLA